jgi:hypothetical protein
MNLRAQTCYRKCVPNRNKTLGPLIRYIVVVIITLLLIWWLLRVYFF